MRWILLLALVNITTRPVALFGCTLCGGDLRTQRTLRQEISDCDATVVGELGPARLLNEDGAGQTDLIVQTVLRGSFLSPGQRLELDRYLPISDETGRRGLFFFRRTAARWELSGMKMFRGDDFLAYVNDLIRHVNKGQQLTTKFFVQFLDAAHEEIARDAFLELARAPDAEVAAAARCLPPSRLRRLLLDPKTPVERRGLLAFLLACAGDPSDLQHIHRLLRESPADQTSTRRGLFAAYIVLQPRQGWRLVLSQISDERQGFVDRHMAFGVIVFMKNWRAEADKEHILQGMKAAILSGDLTDLAAEELRRWQWWDLTDILLDCFGRSTHDSPIVRRAILRYAVSCPSESATRFVEKVRRIDPELVSEVVQSLREETTIDR